MTISPSGRRVRGYALVAAIILAVAAIALHPGSAGQRTTRLGDLSLVSTAGAEDVATITQEQAVATALQAFAERAPGFDFSGIATPTAGYLPGLTQVKDALDGSAIYTRNEAINAWVVRAAAKGAYFTAVIDAASGDVKYAEALGNIDVTGANNQPPSGPPVDSGGDIPDPTSGTVGGPPATIPNGDPCIYLSGGCPPPPGY